MEIYAGKCKLFLWENVSCITLTSVLLNARKVGGVSGFNLISGFLTNGSFTAGTTETTAGAVFCGGFCVFWACRSGKNPNHLQVTHYWLFWLFKKSMSKQFSNLAFIISSWMEPTEQSNGGCRDSAEYGTGDKVQPKTYWIGFAVSVCKEQKYCHLGNRKAPGLHRNMARTGELKVDRDIIQQYWDAGCKVKW